jgi:tRNA 5-methylaminomethyl-2-thiouridine biosynthesis bifunctional protein
MNAELFNSAPLFSKEIDSQKNNHKIAIIGGGISSICLSYHLFQQEPSLDITLYCSDKELGTRGSGNKQGAIYPLLQGGKFSVLAELYAQCYPFAINFYKEANKLGVQFPHQWCGVLQQAFTPELTKRLLQIATEWPAHGQYMSAEQSSTIANLPLPFESLFFKDGGWISPKEFCQHTAAYLLKHHKMQIIVNKRVTKLHQSEAHSSDSFLSRPRKWQLESESNTLKEEYDQVVVCSGHLANQYKQTSQYAIVPIRGQVSHLRDKTPASLLSTVLCHKGYMTPLHGQVQCFGATFDRDNNDESTNLKDNTRNLIQLQKVYTQQNWANELIKTDITGQNAAIRATSQDHHPVVGEVMSDQWVKTNVDQNNGKLKRLDKLKKQSYPNSDHYGLYIMTGLGARGLTTAPLMAKHLTALMLNRKSTLPERIIKSISPMRFQVRELKRNKTV